MYCINLDIALKILYTIFTIGHLGRRPTRKYQYSYKKQAILVSESSQLHHSFKGNGYNDATTAQEDYMTGQ